MGAQGISIEEVGVDDAWTRLKTDPACVLIDVRTRSEWAFVGVADLSAIGKQPLLLEWQNFPDSRVHDDFAERLAEMLSKLA